MSIKTSAKLINLSILSFFIAMTILGADYQASSLSICHIPVRLYCNRSNLWQALSHFYSKL